MCFLANLKKLKDEKAKATRVKWEAAKKVVARVLIYYNKAGIKTKDEKNMAKIIEQLHADFQYIVYHPGPTKDTFKANLQSFWPRYIIQDMKKIINSKRNHSKMQKVITVKVFRKHDG